MKKLYLFLFLLSSISSCTTLKKVNKPTRSGDFKLQVYQGIDDLFILKITNKSNHVINSYCPMLSHDGNDLFIYTPSGVEIGISPKTGGAPSKELHPKLNHIILFRPEKYIYYSDYKETGNYRFVWHNKRLNYKTEFYYYYDFEKVKRKYEIIE